MMSSCLLPFLCSLPSLLGPQDWIQQDQGARQPVVEQSALRLYEVRDLILVGSPTPEIRGGLDPSTPPATLDPASQFQRKTATEEDTARWQGRMDDLLQSLEVHAPGTFELHAAGIDRFVMQALPSTHAWVEEYLEIQRKATKTLFSVEVQIIEWEQGASQRLLGEAVPSHVFANKGELKAFLKRVDSETHERLASPRLLTYARQSTNLSALDQFAYVKSYKLEIVEPGSRALADPEVAVVQEGVVADLTVTPLPQERIGVSLAISLLHVERPIPTKEIHLSPSIPPVTISTPEVTEVQVGGQIELQPESSIALIASTPDGKNEVCVVVHVRPRSPMELRADVPEPPRQEGAKRRR